MRFFKAPAELFNSLRLQVMELKEMPNPKAEQPWNVDITTLALNQHEYEPPEFAAIIEFALANGGEEITEEEYRELQPQPLEE
jgi:hypothetical protein